MQEFNVFLFQSLNNLASINIIASISIFFADFPIFFIPLFLLWMWVYYTFTNQSSQKNRLLLIFYSCIAAIFIALIIQQFIHLDRPETAISWAGKLLLDHIPDASFPSDHASVSVAFLTALFLSGYKKVFWVYLPFVIIMLFSRIISWVHWPFDILVWIIVGISGAAISIKRLSQIKFVKKLNSFIILVLSYIKL